MKYMELKYKAETKHDRQTTHMQHTFACVYSLLSESFVSLCLISIHFFKAVIYWWIAQRKIFKSIYYIFNSFILTQCASKACQAKLWKAANKTSFVFSAEMPRGCFRILGTVQLSDPGGFSFFFLNMSHNSNQHTVFYQLLSHKFFLYNSSIKTKLEKLQILR